MCVSKYRYMCRCDTEKVREEKRGKKREREIAFGEKEL